MKVVSRASLIGLFSLSLIGSMIANASAQYPLLPYTEGRTAQPLVTKCLMAPAREQSQKAVEFVKQHDYENAFAYAGSAWQYQGACRDPQGEKRYSGDAMLVIAFVFLHRGEMHAANVDAGIATALYQECVASPRELASHDYCKGQIAMIDRMSK